MTEIKFNEKCLTNLPVIIKSLKFTLKQLESLVHNGDFESLNSDYLTVPEATIFLKVNKFKLDSWRKYDSNTGHKPRIPYIKLGGRIFYHKKDLLEFKSKITKQEAQKNDITGI